MHSIGLSGSTAGALLVSRSGLSSDTAAQHLLYDPVDPGDAPRFRGFMVNMGSFMGMR